MTSQCRSGPGTAASAWPVPTLERTYLGRLDHEAAGGRCGWIIWFTVNYPAAAEPVPALACSRSERKAP